jgi:single-stranded-DNA-specific exonuclease
MPEAALKATRNAPPAPAAPAPAAALRPVPAVSPGAARRPEPRLEVPPYDFAASLALERELGVSHVLGQILVRRGLTDAASARAFLAAGEEHDPSEFTGIDDAVAVIGRHVRAGSPITVHGDYDVDGVCATAILVRALRALGAEVNWFLPGRVEDGYGLSGETVRRLASRGTALLVTVDCGITAVEEVAAARALGLDVVVTDHHAPRADGLLPDAPIVHPGVCGYPCAELCGTGVAFKLAQALGAPSLEDELELVALATVADLVPLRGENRRLVRAGLRALANTARPGLRALMRVAQADPSGLSTQTLGFRLAPRINAAGRMRRADAALELLMTGDEQRAGEIAAELDAVNGERRAVEQRILWEAEAQVAELGDRSAYVLAGVGWHPGVIGVVASRIVEQHHRPAILIAFDDRSPQVAGAVGTGSGRSIPGFDLLGALHSAAGELIRYGGHRAAAGVTIERERVGAFRFAIEAHAELTLTPGQLQPVERVDAVVAGDGLGLAAAEELALLEPCGSGNPGPRLLVPGARFADVRPMGEGRHARFTVRSGGASARAVAFGCEGRLPGADDAPLDATFRLERNVWKGALEPRLVLRHAQPCAPAAIELLGESADYLAAVLEELDGQLAPQPASAAGSAAGSVLETVPGAASYALAGAARTVSDRRGESPLSVLADAVAAGGPVLAVCADVERRIEGLSARAGGFSLVSYHALERESELAERFRHVVALDPPAGVKAAGLLRRGSAADFTHFAWGEAELRFAQQMNELEYELRASLVSFYRGLRQRGRVAGEELERLLRGDRQPGRPARLAGRLIRVLAELELVSLDRDLLALAIGGSAPTALERSAAYRVYEQRYEDGRRFLSSAKVRTSA